MLEAENHGCICVVPDRLSYCETFNNRERFLTISEVAEMVWQGINNYKKPDQRYFPNADDIVKRI